MKTYERMCTNGSVFRTEFFAAKIKNLTDIWIKYVSVAEDYAEKQESC